MIQWLKSLLSRKPSSNRATRIFHFEPHQDKVLMEDCVEVDEDAWRIDVSDEKTIRLFEIPNPQVEHCILTFRAKMKATNTEKRAYLEMWCRIPNKGEFFSKGFNNTVSGTTEWASYEIPFFLRRDQGPDLIKLNLVMEGAGTLHVKEIEVLKADLPS